LTSTSSLSAMQTRLRSIMRAQAPRATSRQIAMKIMALRSGLERPRVSSALAPGGPRAPARPRTKPARWLRSYQIVSVVNRVRRARSMVLQQHVGVRQHCARSRRSSRAPRQPPQGRAVLAAGMVPRLPRLGTISNLRWRVTRRGPLAVRSSV
jgi:hypothetical protein